MDGHRLDDAGKAAEILCELLVGGYQRFTCLGFQDCGLGESVKGVDHAVAHIVVYLVLFRGLVCHSVVGDASKCDEFSLGLESYFSVLLPCRPICGLGGVCCNDLPLSPHGVHAAGSDCVFDAGADHGGC